MSDDSQERRFGDANTFQDAFDSLESVKSHERRKFLHDRVMSQIDQVCKKHMHEGALPFSLAQIEVIKDVVYSVVHVFDPKSRKPKGFLRACGAEFLAKSPLAQLAAVTFSIGVAAAGVTGMVAAYDAVRVRWFDGPKGGGTAQPVLDRSRSTALSPIPAFVVMDRLGSLPPVNPN